MDDYQLVSLGGKNTLFLPDTLIKQEAVRAQALEKAQRASSGKIFSDWAKMGGRLRSVGPGIDKPADTLSFEMLRSLADASPIDRVIIDTRIMQIKRVSRVAQGRDSLGFAVQHVRHNDPDFDVPDGIDKLCREIEEIISAPTAPFHQHFTDLLVSAVEEELVIDRKAMVLARDRKGRPIKYHLVDGATIKPVPSILFKLIKEHYDKTGDVLSVDQALEEIWNLWEIDLTNKAYVQEVDARVVAAWEDSEMSIDITNPSVQLNRWGYGRSLLEKSWQISDAFMKAWTYNIELFSLNYPESVLLLVGDYDEEGLGNFRRRLLGEDGGRLNWRLPVLPVREDERARIESVKLRDTPKDMMFNELLQHIVNLKCAAYRMHPSMVNFNGSASGGDGITIQGNASQEAEIEQSQEEGYKGLLDSLSDWLTRTIVKEYDKDLRFVWVGLNQESEDARVTRITQKVQSLITINEARAELGLKPLPKEMPTEPGEFIGSYTQALQMLQGGAQGGEGQPGAPGAEGGAGYDEGGDFGDPQQETPWWKQDKGGGDDEGDGSEGLPGSQRGKKTPGTPQKGGPQHVDEEMDDAEPVKKSQQQTKFLRIRIS